MVTKYVLRMYKNKNKNNTVHIDILNKHGEFQFNINSFTRYNPVDINQFLERCN